MKSAAAACASNSSAAVLSIAADTTASDDRKYMVRKERCSFLKTSIAVEVLEVDEVHFQTHAIEATLGRLDNVLQYSTKCANGPDDASKKKRRLVPIGTSPDRDPGCLPIGNFGFGEWFLYASPLLGL